MRPRHAVLVLAASLYCCNSSSPSSPANATSNASCTASGQVGFVKSTLQEWYYWYERLPGTNSAGFTTAEAYLEAVRYKPIDSSYSTITSKASSDAFFSDSQFIGFGLAYERTGDSELRLVQTFPGSPAADAGLDRGDFLLSVNGKPIADLLRTGEINTVFGGEQLGVTADIAWRSLATGAARQASLAKRLVTIPTVSQTAVLANGGSRVGYVHLRNFVQPSLAALDAAFSRLKEGAATDLVLDLRYNGGGLVSVAQHLASLIGGTATAGQVFVQFTHNDRQSSRNTAFRFESLPQALGVSRLVVITTRGSASASEAIINGLRPYLDVKVVGDTTYGKPVGQYGFDFCDKVLYPVAFLVTNARGEADYFSGIPADCAAADDVDQPLASPGEASLAEALYVLQTGRCSGAASAAALVRARLRANAPEIRPADGWRQTLNAW